jgi:hypothetical protein
MPSESPPAATRWQKLRADLVALVQTEGVQRWLKLASPVFLATIVVVLAYQLTRIGWGATSRSIPTSPLFYLLFAVFYVALPGSEALIYDRLWRCGFWRLLPRTCVKHVCNQDVFELTGEVYFYVWSTKRLGREPGQTLRTIKDITILSAVVGYLVTVALPPVCQIWGALGPRQGLSSRQSLLVELACPALFAGILCFFTAIRRKLFFLPGKALLEVSAVHLARFVLMNLILVAQWKVVLPDQPWRALWTLLVVSNMAGRLPSFLSNNLVFVAAGIELSTRLGLPPAPVAGMLLANTALDKLVNLSVVAGTTLAGRLRRSDESVAATDELPQAADLERVA